MNRRSTSHIAGPVALAGLMAVAAFAAQPAPGVEAPPDPPAEGQAAAPAPVPAWVAVAASGKVTRREAGTEPDAWSKVRRGDLLAPLTHVRSEDRGRATLTRDGDIILVSPGSMVTLPDGRNGAPDTIRQTSGRALYQVEPGREGRFEVVTPLLVAGVKGTQFSVIVRDGFTAVEVVEGHVEVQSLLDREDRRDLFAGDVLTLDARERRMDVFQEDRQETRSFDTARERREFEVREETKRLSRDLSMEKSMFDFESLWKERMADQFEGKNETLRRETDFQALEEKMTVLKEDETRQESTTGTVNVPPKP